MRDLIYRDEALNEVAVGKDKNEIQGGILNLPSVEAKELIAKIEIDNDKLTELVEKVKADLLENQKTGHWIIHKLEPNGYDHIKCSVCGQFWSVSDHYKIFKYCFNCGAKMEGENK